MEFTAIDPIDWRAFISALNAPSDTTHTFYAALSQDPDHAVEAKRHRPGEHPLGDRKTDHPDRRLRRHPLSHDVEDPGSLSVSKLESEQVTILSWTLVPIAPEHDQQYAPRRREKPNDS